MMDQKVQTDLNRCLVLELQDLKLVNLDGTGLVMVPVKDQTLVLVFRLVDRERRKDPSRHPAKDLQVRKQFHRDRTGPAVCLVKTCQGLVPQGFQVVQWDLVDQNRYLVMDLLGQNQVSRAGTGLEINLARMSQALIRAFH